MSAEATVVRNYLDWMTDLPWSNKSKINTVSIIQARKPIYASSSNLSDNYQAHLGDYFKELSAID